jgi:hypothetical protein
MNILPYLLCCHCIGDGVLQNHWMQRKAVDSWVCTVHVLAYSAPFLAFATGGPSGPPKLHWLVLILILGQHWLQDRLQLHIRWMTWWGQTPASAWPVGPLYVDQCWHVGWLMVFALINGIITGGAQ